MAVTYTNRKGVTYTLCQITTKMGQTRYVFVRDPTGRETVTAVPEGWEIRESINGIVSLAQAREQCLLPEEIAAVQGALDAHRNAYNYRLDVKPECLVIYEGVGPEADVLVEAVEAIEAYDGAEVSSALRQRLRNDIENHGRFSPVLRFILNDAETHDFRAERRGAQRRSDDWIFVDSGNLADLAQTWVPRLGTDDFFKPY